MPTFQQFRQLFFRVWVRDAAVINKQKVQNALVAVLLKGSVKLQLLYYINVYAFMATYVLYLKCTCTFRIFIHSFLYKLQSRVIISDSVSKMHLCSKLSEQKIQCLPIGTSV
jgi:hypothetical protein